MNLNFNKAVQDAVREKQEEVAPDICKLCHGTGEYWIHNSKVFYRCYACDAADEKELEYKLSKRK